MIADVTAKTITIMLAMSVLANGPSTTAYGDSCGSMGFSVVVGVGVGVDSMKGVGVEVGNREIGVDVGVSVGVGEGVAVGAGVVGGVGIEMDAGMDGAKELDSLRNGVKLTVPK